MDSAPKLVVVVLFQQQQIVKEQTPILYGCLGPGVQESRSINFIISVPWIGMEILLRVKIGTQEWI